MKRQNFPGSYTVETFQYDPVRVACHRCDRRGQYAKATLRERYGADAAMPDVLTALANCKHIGNWSTPCGAHLPDAK